MNVSDQSSIFIHETKMLISICSTEQMAENKTFKKRDVIALKRQYVFLHYCDTPEWEKVWSQLSAHLQPFLSALSAYFSNIIQKISKKET